MYSWTNLHQNYNTCDLQLYNILTESIDRKFDTHTSSEQHCAQFTRLLKHQITETQIPKTT